MAQHTLPLFHLRRCCTLPDSCIVSTLILAYRTPPTLAHLLALHTGTLACIAYLCTCLHRLLLAHPHLHCTLACTSTSVCTTHWLDCILGLLAYTTAAAPAYLPRRGRYIPACIHKCIHAHLHTPTHARAHIHTHTLTHIHTQTYLADLQPPAVQQGALSPYHHPLWADKETSLTNRSSQSSHRPHTPFNPLQFPASHLASELHTCSAPGQMPTTSTTSPTLAQSHCTTICPWGGREKVSQITLTDPSSTLSLKQHWLRGMASARGPICQR